MYTFLEGLGARWFLPGEIGEVVPQRRTIRIDPIDVSYVPDFAHRNLWIGAPSSAMTLEEKGMYSTWWARNRLGGVPASSGPAFHRLFPPDEYFERHPEYYALLGGERSADGQLCTSNPEVVRLAVEKARSYFDRNPDATVFSLSPNEGYGWCECDSCAHLDPPEARGKRRGKARRLTLFVNEVAREVRRTHPDKRLSFYASAGRAEPPGDVRVAPNVLVVVAHDGFCHAHPITDPSCRANVRFRAMLEGWRDVADHLHVREYYGRWAAPWPTARMIAEDLVYLRGLGVEGFSAEIGANGEGAWLGAYVASRFLWDSGDDPYSVLNDLYTRFYGPAALPMARYFRILEKAFRRTRMTLSGAVHWIPSIYTPEVLDACDRALREAEGLADESIFRRRVALSLGQMKFMRGYLRTVEEYLNYDASGEPIHLATAREAARQVTELIDAMDGQVFLAKPAFEVSVRPFLRWLDREAERTTELLRPARVVAQVPRFWRFRFDPEDVGEREGWYDPAYDDGEWNATDTFTFWEGRFGDYDGYAWYRTKVHLPAACRGNSIRLYFGAVDEGGWIYVNGRLVKVRPFVPPDGWRRPFEVEITDAVRFGAENLLAVRVLDRSGTGGIWRPVKIVTDR